MMKNGGGDMETPSVREVIGVELAASDLTAVIMRLRNVLAAGIRSLMPAAILPMAQVDVLQRLAAHGPTRVSDIAAMSRLAINTVSTIVSQLESGQLIERSRSTTDRRVVLIDLTPVGRQRLDEWLALTDNVLLEAIGRLPDDTQERVRDAIPALVELADSVDVVFDIMEAERAQATT